MFRALTALAACVLAAPAMAHPGHILGEVAGHDHVVAGAAIGIAIAIGLWGAIKGKPKDEEAEPEEEAEELEGEEQPA